MSSISVRQTTQKIVVDASTGAVSVISAGAQGPAGPAGEFPITLGDTPPVAPNIEDLWINTTTFTLHVYYNDGDSVQWVEVGSIDIGDIDLAALADSLVPYILNDPDFEAGAGGGGDSTPPTATHSGTTKTIDLADIGRLNLFDNAAQVTVTIPAATFANGDWTTIQSTGAGGITFDTTGLTVVNGPLPDLAEFESITIIFTSANTITYANGSGGGTPPTPTDPTPPAGTVAGATHTLDTNDLARLTMFSEAAQVTVTAPTATFANGDWFTLQPLGAGGLTLDLTGLTVNGGTTLLTVAQGEAISVIYTAADTVSVIGGTS